MTTSNDNLAAIVFKMTERVEALAERISEFTETIDTLTEKLEDLLKNATVQWDDNRY